MATKALGTVAVGSTVKLKESGQLVEFLVVHQGKPSTLYDDSCTGTWLLRKDLHSSRVWDGTSSNYNNKYEESDIKIWLNGDYLNMFEENIRNAIKTVKIPYRSGGGSGGTDQQGANGLSCKVFLLSGYEVGWTQTTNQYFPHDGDVLEYFKGTAATDPKRIANLSGSATDWWLRSPNTGDANSVRGVYSNGNYYYGIACSSYGVRPALVLPSTLLVSDDGSVSTNTAPTAPTGIKVNGQASPAAVNSGVQLNISWDASTDKEGDTVKYEVKRYLDGSPTGTQVALGNDTKTTDTIPMAAHTSVIYGVTAIDGTDSTLRSAETKTATIKVVNNVAPSAPASITVPATVKGGESLVITWGAATDSDSNLAGYELERKYNGGEYTQIFKGNQLTHTDQITKGWTSVQYRVRAYDALDATSSYTESQSRTVDNNTAPAITCDDHESGSDLGEKTDGFTIEYKVDDVDADTVNVVEAIDGVQVKTFQAVLKQSNTFDITGDTWQKVLNGQHTLTVTANDGKASSVFTLTFSKKVKKATITLKTPLDADAEITLAVLSVIGNIPGDATYKVEACNNAKDDVPNWEDVTQAVKTGANIIFQNKQQTKGWAFNFRITVEEGDSGTGGFISSIQGGFQ